MTAEDNAKFVRDWLNEREWRFSEKSWEDGDITFRTSISSDSEVYKGYDITIICRKNDVQSLFFVPANAPEKRRGEIAELLMRINYRFRIGKFTMDYRDGELRWETVKTHADFVEDKDNAIDDIIGFPGFVLDKFTPGIAAVLLGLKTPEQAYLDCDKDPEPPADNPPPTPPSPESPDDIPTCGGGTEADAPAEEGSGGKKRSSKRGKKAKAEASPEASTARLPKGYSLKGLNIQGKIPLEKIVAAVKKFRASASRPEVDAPRLNILLSGAPGSGKTAFARYLAGQVGAELRTIRASELLSKWVGETEKKLAEVFKEAKSKGQILFLDEIDSFLQDREHSDHSWEVTQVNELLQQMEEFQGVMIGATNFADRLDKAVLRRFTYKLKLDYLTDEGKGIFFERFFKTPLTEGEKQRLDSISKLTPGDFRTVREELFYLADKQSNAARLDALEAESEAKGRTAEKIGF